MAKSPEPTPRWLYRFLTWFRQTPLNGAPLALLLFLISAGLYHWASWQAGSLPKYQIDAGLLFPALWLPANILFWLWLDGMAHTAIQDFIQGQGGNQAKVSKTFVEFISVGETVGFVLLAGALAFSAPDAIQRAASYGITEPLTIILIGLLPALGGVLEGLSLFRLIRQLFLVNSLYKDVKRVNLFNLWHIYALSRYGYTIALVFILAIILIDAILTLVGAGSIGFGYILYTVGLAFIIFIAPLLGINTRLRNEKQRELQRLGTELNSVYGETEGAVSSRKFAKISDLRIAGTAIREQMESVSKVATWPWNPGSLRNLLIPVLLPLFLAILQRYVITWLGL
ncbi:MAG: hypothetical protein WD751_07975 [Anaerolineales bacterium]